MGFVYSSSRVVQLIAFLFCKDSEPPQFGVRHVRLLGAYNVSSFVGGGYKFAHFRDGRVVVLVIVIGLMTKSF